MFFLDSTNIFIPIPDSIYQTITFRILQVNVQSISNKSNKDSLEFFLENKDIFKNRSDGFGGVGIVIRCDIKFSMIDVVWNAEIVGINILNLKKNVNLLSTYVPQSTSLSNFKNFLQVLEVAVRRLTGPTLIVGGFNAKASLWGSTSTDR